MMWVESEIGDALINLARFDGVRVNGRCSGRGAQTHWLEAYRYIDGEKDEEGFCTACEVERIYFCYDEDEIYRALDAVKALIAQHEPVLCLDVKAIKESHAHLQPEEWIEDGHGSMWPRICDACGEENQIMKPGKVQCGCR